MEYSEIVRFVSVRWLSLDAAINRILLVYPSLRSYFLSESESQERFKRLAKAFGNPMTEIYLLFFQSVLPTFNRFNLFLQREEPSIFLVADGIQSFLKSLLGRFLTIESILSSDNVENVDFMNPNNHLHKDDVSVGMITKQCLHKCLENGDITPQSVKVFYSSVHQFFTESVTYALTKLPVRDTLLQHARFLNVMEKVRHKFSSVEFFCEKYSALLKFSPTILDLLHEEFIEYQLLDKSIITEHQWNEAIVSVSCADDETPEKNVYYRMDTIWGFISELKKVDSSPRFKYLSMVAKLVLCIPHSNAGEERVFNLIKLKKTPSRNSLNPNGTLSSIVKVKLV